MPTTPVALPSSPGSWGQSLGTDIRSGNQAILVDQYIQSNDGRFRLNYQVDGNLVLYGPGGAVLWNLGVTSARPSEFIVQNDCNLVLYDSAGHSYWDKGTSCSGPVLRLQNDGNLVLRSGGTLFGPVVWSSGTVY
jgi:hypothetical protein